MYLGPTIPATFEKSVISIKLLQKKWQSVIPGNGFRKIFQPEFKKIVPKRDEKEIDLTSHDSRLYLPPAHQKQDTEPDITYSAII